MKLTATHSDFSFACCSYITPWNSVTDEAPPKIVVTCVMRRGSKLLALQRARQDDQFHLWGIPGGKLFDGEPPTEGLSREIEEETGLLINPDDFYLLGTAQSRTPTDGIYGLYLFYATIPSDREITIDPREHNDYKWVSIDQFLDLRLLTAQREAFNMIEKEARKLFL